MGDTVFTPIDLIEKVKWLGRVLEHPTLSAEAKAVAAALFHRHNTQTGRCDPGAEDLARLAGLSRRGAQNARDELVAAGFVEAIVRRVGDPERPRFLSNAYRLLGCAARTIKAAMAAPTPSAPDARGGSARRALEPKNPEPKRTTDVLKFEKEGVGSASAPRMAQLIERLNRSQEGAQLARRWLVGVALDATEPGVWRLAAPTRAVRDWLIQHAALLRAAVTAVDQAVDRIDIEVAAA